MPGKLRRSVRGLLEERRWQSLEERGSAGTQLRPPVLTRSQTCEPRSCSEPQQAALAPPGPPSLSPPPQQSKRATSYRKAFGELAEQEALLGCFSCAWHREVPYHGRLYVSSRHLCFHASLMLKDIKVVVPIASISALKKTNTALLVPNALSVRTADGEKLLFVSLHRREAAFQLLQALCRHLQDPSQSPSISPGITGSLRKLQPSGQAGVEQSTPEPESLLELPDRPHPAEEEEDDNDDDYDDDYDDDDEDAAAPAPSSAERVPLAKPHSPWALWARTTARLSPLDTVILIYLLLMLALLVSSGYIGLRLMELEQRLVATGAWPDLDLPEHYRTT